MQDRSFWQVIIDTTKTAAMFGAARSFITTPLWEVTLTNIERIKQTQLHKTQCNPETGVSITQRLYRANQLNTLFTGVGPNMVKNFSREVLRAYAWLLTPMLVKRYVKKEDIEKYPIIIPAVSVGIVVGVNGTMNSFFDGLRNKQMDTRNRTGVSINSIQAGRTLIKEYGFFGLFHGAKITYIYSAAFWGSFAASKEGYTRLAQRFSCDVNHLYSQTAINIMSGVNAGIVTMPVEHLRYQILSGDLPTSPLKGYQAFKARHGAMTSIRLFCGLPQSLPIQISASLLAGTLLYFQKQNEQSR